MLSILMPVYNERERVERAISSVLATELPTDFELIVVNDGSTDGSGDLVSNAAQDGRVRLLEHPENRGKGAAIKTALGKLETPEALGAAVVREGFEPLPITFDHADRAGALPPHHRDPFDRMLVAQALTEGLTLVTHDPAFDPYGVEVLRV